MLSSLLLSTSVRAIPRVIIMWATNAEYNIIGKHGSDETTIDIAKRTGVVCERRAGVRRNSNTSPRGIDEYL